MVFSIRTCSNSNFQSFHSQKHDIYWKINEKQTRDSLVNVIQKQKTLSLESVVRYQHTLDNIIFSFLSYNSFSGNSTTLL